MSASQILHISRLIIAPSSDVGFCWYCASHLLTGISALIASSSDFFQNSGQSGVPDGNNAGSSITSHSSPSLLIELSKICPVKSRLDHRVITTTIAPPGCKRCRGPDEYHSNTLSYTAGFPSMASCSECGSSMIRTSAPLPVTAPPTPIAK